MDQDKKLFQETAQKLINYDFEHRIKYSCGGINVAYGAKKFYAHRIVLAVFAAEWIYAIMHGMYLSVREHVFLGALFAVFYIRYRKKMKKVKEVLAVRKNILNSTERIECKNILDELSGKHPEWQTEPWWNTMAGMDVENGRYASSIYEIEYYASPLVSENKSGKKVVSGEANSMANIVSGEEINEKIQSGGCKRLDLTPAIYRDEEEYHMAGLYLHRSSPNYEYYSYAKNSQYDVNEQMAEYKEKLDRKEKSKNWWSESGYYETNKEKHWRRGIEHDNYDVHKDIDDWFTRQRKEEKQRFKIENEIETERYIASYDHDMYFVGYIIWNDKRSDQISTILLSKDKMIHSYFQTKTEDISNAHIIGERDLSEKEKFIPMPITSVISKLWNFNLGDMDYTMKRPEDFTAEEWASWIYVHVKD